MSKGQKAAPRSEWAESTKQKQVQWQKLNRAKLSADLPKQEGDSFRAICKKENVSVSAALSVFVRACLQADSLDVIRDDIPKAGGRRRDDGGRRIDPARQNDTPGTVDLPTANETHGTVCRHPVSDTPGTVGKLDSLCNMTKTHIFPAE